MEAYHRFRQLAQALLEINEKICRARPVEQELVPAKKTAEIIQQEVAREAEHLLQLLLGAGEQTAPLDLEAVEMAIRGSMHQAGAAVISHVGVPSAQLRTATTRLRRPRPLCRVTFETGADRGGQCRMRAPLISVRELPSWSVSGRLITSGTGWQARRRHGEPSSSTQGMRRHPLRTRRSCGRLEDSTKASRKPNKPWSLILCQLITMTR